MSYTATKDAWIARMQQTKARQAPLTHHLISEWVKKCDDYELDMCTFLYVVRYWNEGLATFRLPMALAEIGYTKAELDALKADGKTLVSVAQEVLARGVAQ